jgi:hypothetical protein
MAFRNFLNSQRWKIFSHSFGKHSSRVAQQDFNATVVDYIEELEKQIRELSMRIDHLEGRNGAGAYFFDDDQGSRRAFMKYQTEGKPARKLRKPDAYPYDSEDDHEEIEHDDIDNTVE